MPALILDKLRKEFADGTVAVNDLDLTIEERAFVTLLGPSGCGKTTTLRMVAGLEQPTRGVIRLGERVLNDVPPVRRDIAMVFQSYALYPHMTVGENMGFSLRLRNADKAMTGQRVAAAVIITIPIILFVLFFQRRIVAGLTSGAVKG